MSEAPGDAIVNSFLVERLGDVSISCRKLFAVIVRQAYYGPIHPKNQGTATPPEILEACGLDVGEFYGLLEELKRAGLIKVENSYPFEEIQLSPEAVEARWVADRCAKIGQQLDNAFVNLNFPA